MTFIETLQARNAAFVKTDFNAALKMLPTQKTLLLGCVDPRVDPVDVLGVKLGEAAIIRNVGGRVTPSTLDTLAMLGVVSKRNGGQLGPNWNLIVLHHTDCGIKKIDQAPELLATFFGSPDLERFHVMDPYKSVVYDTTALKDNPAVPRGFTVTGLVYDVATGLVEVVVPPTLL